jgi:hypothetical protein
MCSKDSEGCVHVLSQGAISAFTRETEENPDIMKTLSGVTET